MPLVMPTFSPRFLACLPYTLIQECPLPNDWPNHRNFSDDPGDTGGQTMVGITHSEYNVWRKRWGLAPRPVIQLTRDEGYTIYWESYWQPECPKLPPGLDLAFFDDAVNMGTGEAVKILQYSLGKILQYSLGIGMEMDGEWGPKTDAAVAAIPLAGWAEAIQTYTRRRHDVYETFRGFARFGSDWERRDAEIGAEALRMAAA